MQQSNQTTNTSNADVKPVNKHPHAEAIMEYAKDAMLTDKPWELWEFSNDDAWLTHKNHPQWHQETKYRRKPKTININGYEVPEPLRVAPVMETEYYTCELDQVCTFFWEGCGFDKNKLKLGLVHSTKEAAELHRKALLSFTTME